MRQPFESTWTHGHEAAERFNAQSDHSWIGYRGSAVLASATILATALPHYVPVTQQCGVMFRLNQSNGAIEVCSCGPTQTERRAIDVAHSLRHDALTYVRKHVMHAPV